MNPELKLHRAILDALKEFPGIDRITIRINPHGIEVIYYHGDRAASYHFLFHEYSGMEEDRIRDLLCQMFDKMARSVRPNHPGQGAAWGWSKFP
jgi:hypothetical protein